MANDHDGLNKQQYDKEAVMAGCDDVEMTITAPDGTEINKDNPRYEAQPDFRLITVNASGFPVGLIALSHLSYLCFLSILVPVLKVFTN